MTPGAPLYDISSELHTVHERMAVRKSYSHIALLLSVYIKGLYEVTFSFYVIYIAEAESFKKTRLANKFDKIMQTQILCPIGN